MRGDPRRGEDIDVVEIDGASNRGIDDARDLIAGAGIAPARGPWKIYIIDEVHMLTVQAFNALLKTMEEPPPHVKFILCTTEPHKVPATIQSRCQRFDFRNIAARGSPAPTAAASADTTAVSGMPSTSASSACVIRPSALAAAVGAGDPRAALERAAALLEGGTSVEQA
ncbi:MAG: AAA family ATPase, partial [Phycisphaerales bacterium]